MQLGAAKGKAKSKYAAQAWSQAHSLTEMEGGEQTLTWLGDLELGTTRSGLHSVSRNLDTSLAVQWLRLHDSTEEGVVSLPGWRTKISHAAKYNQKKLNETNKNTRSI